METILSILMKYAKPTFHQKGEKVEIGDIKHVL